MACTKLGGSVGGLHRGILARSVDTRRNQPPGLHRQCLFGGLRIGLYDPVKRLIVGKDHVGDVSLPSKIAAGLLTGASVLRLVDC